MYKCSKCNKKSTLKSNLKCDRCTPSSDITTIPSETSNPFISIVTDYDTSRTGSDYSGGGGTFDGGGASGDW